MNDLDRLDLFDEGPASILLGAAEQQLRRRVREVVARDVAPAAAQWDRAGEFAGSSYQALAAAGLGGLLFPRELGGQEQSTLGYAIAVEEIAAACPATSLIYMTQMHAAFPILVAGTDIQRKRHIPDLCAGRAYGALAVTEPDAGSDVAALRTTARRTPQGYELSGAKTFITTGDRAEVIVVFASVDRARGRHGITAFVVDGDPPGLSRSRPFHKLGMAGSSTAELTFDRVRLAEEARLGAEGSAWKLSMATVTKSRISAAAQGVGIAKGVFARTVAALAAAGALRSPWLDELAAMKRRIAAGQLLLYGTAAAADQAPGPTVADVAVMKATCTDLGADVAVAAMDVLGPFGDLADLGVEQAYRDARVTRIYDGTNEIQHVIIGRELAQREESRG